MLIIFCLAVNVDNGLIMLAIESVKLRVFNGASRKSVLNAPDLKGMCDVTIF